jgi:hypothetical protein
MPTGGAGGGVLLLIVVAIIAVCVVRSKRRKQRAEKQTSDNAPSGAVVRHRRIESSRERERERSGVGWCLLQCLLVDRFCSCMLQPINEIPPALSASAKLAFALIVRSSKGSFVERTNKQHNTTQHNKADIALNTRRLQILLNQRTL